MHQTGYYRFVSFVGLLGMMAIAYTLSENRSAIKLRIVAWGLGLQLLLAVFVLKTPPGDWLFGAAKGVFGGLISSSNEGASFLFGKLTSDPSYGALIAFQVLPIIIFVSSISAVLYHLKVIQKVVQFMAWLMQKTMKISGAESLSAALFVFSIQRTWRSPIEPVPTTRIRCMENPLLKTNRSPLADRFTP